MLGKSKKGLLLVLSALLLCVVGVHAHAVIPSSERNVLISIYLSTHGNQWLQNTNWCDGPCPLVGTPKFNRHGTECMWAGVGCYPDGRHVLELAGSNGMTGALPPLQGLTQLRNIRLAHNSITGAIPDFTGMIVLSDIDLSFNELTGPLPDFSGLVNLSSVDLSDNQLSGPIAPLNNLPQLETFRVSNNQLAGQAPTFAGLYFLTFIAVDNNQLTGALPDLSQLNIDLFYADHNEFTGAVPPPSGFLASTHRSARICPNPLDLAPGPNDAGWDYATGVTPWWGPPGEGCDHIFSDPFE
jgi:hypothetical protein